MPLTPHALAALALTICALILFSRERIPLEYSATAILVTIVMAFELFPLTGPVPLRGAHFLEGFGNDALITICLLLILARGVEVSGGLRPMSARLPTIPRSSSCSCRSWSVWRTGPTYRPRRFSCRSVLPRSSVA
jgi:hypothetical protein